MHGEAHTPDAGGRVGPPPSTSGALTAASVLAKSPLTAALSGARVAPEGPPDYGALGVHTIAQAIEAAEAADREWENPSTCSSS